MESLARTGRAEGRGLRSSLVEDDTDEGGVAGFSQTGNTNFGFAPVLDKFIDRSWRVVWVLSDGFVIYWRSRA